MEGQYHLSPLQTSKFQLLNTKSNKVPIRTNELYILQNKGDNEKTRKEFGKISYVNMLKVETTWLNWV